MKKLFILLLISNVALSQNRTVKVGTGGSSGSGSYINNSTSLQSSSNFNISGYGQVQDSVFTHYMRVGNYSHTTDGTRMFIHSYDTSRLVTADGDLTIVGVGSYPQVSKTSGADGNGTLCGGCFESRIGPYNTTNWSSTIGSVAVRGSVNIQPSATGTLTNGTSLLAAADVGAMSIRYSTGLLVDQPFVHGTGAIVERFGIRIKDVGTIGSFDNWAISSESTAKSYFAGVIGINNVNPDTKALLDIASTTKGALLPRMTTTQKNAITSIPEGLMVYDLTLHKLYVYDGSTWQAAW